jgi:hypothetical protein
MTEFAMRGLRQAPKTEACTGFPHNQKSPRLETMYSVKESRNIFTYN